MTTTTGFSAKRKPLRRVSVRRAAQLKEYAKLRRAYLKAHPICEVWLAENSLACLKDLPHSAPPQSTEIHHRKGRTGAKLNDTTYWLAVCRQSHEMIHQNPKYAYEKGYLLRK